MTHISKYTFWEPNKLVPPAFRSTNYFVKIYCNEIQIQFSSDEIASLNNLVAQFWRSLKKSKYTKD